MPRCDTCLTTMPSAEVRKLPKREAFRCKDKFACLLRRENADPYHITLKITLPAKSLREARSHADYFVAQSKEIPMEILEVTDEHGAKYDAEDIRRAVYR